MRPGTKIAKSGAALLTIAAYPLGRSFGGHIESLRRHLQGTTLFDNHPRHLLSTVNRQSGILVVVHSVSLKNSLLVTTSFSRSDRMDNLLKLHTYSLIPIPWSLIPIPLLPPINSARAASAIAIAMTRSSCVPARAPVLPSCIRTKLLHSPSNRRL